MVARSSSPREVHSHFAPCSFRGALAAGILLALLAPAVVQAGPGKWSPWSDWSDGNPEKYAIHMMLVPGDNSPYHSRILWWNGEVPNLVYGGEWGWRTGDAGCDGFPSSFYDLGLPPSGVNTFCSGHSALPDDAGRILVAGGSDPATHNYGVNLARVYTRGNAYQPGGWSLPSTMYDWRWYPTATSIRGRVFVAGGVQHPHHRMFGGKRDGVLPSGTVADSVYRFAPVVGGKWDAAVIPNPDGSNGKPVPREGHTFVEMGAVPGFAAQVLFGGLKADGHPSDETWFLTRYNNNRTDPDYTYAWTKKNLSAPPPLRSSHTAIVALNSMMVVYGGLGDTGAPRGDVYRLYKDPVLGFQWSPMNISPGPLPARCGHTAIYDETGTLRRMLVFGGTTAPGQTPTDTKVYELQFDAQSPNEATWYARTPANLGDGTPDPRYWHTMNFDPTPRAITVNQVLKQGHTALIFGGALTGSTYSNELWVLWIFNDGTFGWQRKTTSGTPGARARHSATLNSAQGVPSGRLYVFGGESSGAVDSKVYVVDPWGANPTWAQWADPGYVLSGHTAVLDGDITHGRVPEVFDPQTEQFEAYTNSPLHMDLTYPLNFAVPGAAGAGGRVLCVGQEFQTYWLDLPAAGQPQQGWQTLPILSNSFAPQTAVMYSPGRIMIAGNGVGTVGTTKTLDALNLGAGWATSGSMVQRRDHNLVLLPDGKVLVVGGDSLYVDINNNRVLTPIKQPQIWDPATGSWTPRTQLAEQPTVRDYHSVAVLLPDARVLSAGGSSSDRLLANLFCPPYLFKSNGVDTAMRPTISSAPARLTWGKVFTLCAGDPQSITRVCLIRPGATTHSFDENQRYVPLTSTLASNPSRLLVNAPASPDSAPPGYYMLFVTGSVDGPDVPSIARWVTVGSQLGSDACDVTAPAATTDLSGCYYYPFHNPPQGNERQIDLAWTAPADDGTLAASGRAVRYDIRYSYQPINTGSSGNRVGRFMSRRAA